ncbi:MAG TPA: L-fucose/L-arabinose isomerase family protein [Candidatus Deferrimicrobium sp.]|nr:L-fucose/L-arabinose isomerase family protein [Candidatus Deferrimicrobium sp.]
MARATLGVIVGNRDFFPDALVTEARADVLALFAEMDITPVIVDETATKLGGIETRAHAKVCAELFKQHRESIEGIVVILPNFGDEKGVADTMRLSGLDVPILVQAYPDDVTNFTLERRRDSFCGKISVCSDLRQYGYAYTLTERHTVPVQSAEFRADLDSFVRVCKVANGMKTARLGAIGTRPDAFKTVRYSEKLLEASGIAVSVIDLSEIFGRAAKLTDDHAKVTAKLDEIHAHIAHPTAPPDRIVKMARLGVVIDDWMADNDLNASAIQCWNSLQENFGVNVCTLMSIMSNKMMPSACETDITGLASMYALQLAAGEPAAIVDLNNNYGDDPDKCVLFHCGNWPLNFYTEAEMKTAEVLGTTLGADNVWGAINGRAPAAPLTIARISTDDVNGICKAYVAEGRFLDDPLDTFGSRAVVEIPDFQPLLKYICNTGFEHHCAMSPSTTADVVAEALGNYLQWEVYRHE